MHWPIGLRSIDLESVTEMFGIPEFPAIKREIGSLVECTKNDVCMQEFKTHAEKRMAYYFTDTDSSYDYVHQLAVNVPGLARATMIPRNERMAQRLLTSLPKEKKALVIVGAAHIGGPTGLASQLESAKFVKVKCKL